MEPKLTVIIAVLDSHQVFTRQLLHFQKMRLGSQVHFIFVDDGSDPPLTDSVNWLLPNNFSIFATNDTRPWSQPCARNTGAELATSPKLLFTDIDHILSKAAIDFCFNKEADKIMFPRRWGVLTETGAINQKKTVLYEYGLPVEIYEKRGLNAGVHHNTFMIKKSIFDELGGYDESFCGKYGGDDTDFADRYRHMCRVEKKCKPHIVGPPIYVYPDPNRDKLEIFHNLRRKK